MLDCKYINPLKTNLFHSFISMFVLCKKFFDNFHILLNELNINLDIIAITKSHIRENLLCTINIQLLNYSIEHTPTEASAGGALLYINNRLSYKPRSNLKMYAPGKLESVFIEIICQNSSDLIIGCIWVNCKKMDMKMVCVTISIS